MRKIQIFVIGVFLIFLFLPLLFLDFKSEESKREKRVLAKKPILINKNFRPNYKFFIQLDKFIGDRFGFKNFFVSMNAYIKYNIFKKKGNDKVLIGKNGWLFYISEKDGNNLNDFLKTNLLDNESLLKIVKNIYNMKKWCESKNIKFIFLIAPNKHSVYTEYFPFKRPEGKTQREQIVEELLKNGIDCIDPTEYLLKMKKDIPLYNEIDTHWTRLGAYYAFLLLKERLNNIFPLITFPSLEFDIKVNKTKDITGLDLAPMLGLDSYNYSTIVEVNPKNTSWGDLFSLTILPKERKSIEDVVTISSKSPPIKAMVFRDSFCVHLQPFVSTIFSKVYYRWKGMEESDKEIIIKEKPEVIIYELVERWLTGIKDIEFKNDL